MNSFITIHRSMLLQILKDIYKDPSIGPLLGFKGGTAAYLFYDLDRFSVDLDFDLLDVAQQDHIYKGIKKILAKYGTVKKIEKKSHSLLLILSYADKHKNADNIKVEINLRNFGSQYQVKNYLGISMKVMVIPDVAANKLVAMMNRIGRANRDIYDVHFMLKNHWPINEEIIKARTGLSLPEFLHKCTQELEGYHGEDILGGLGNLLNQKQRDWAKKSLLTDTIFLLKVRLESL